MLAEDVACGLLKALKVAHSAGLLHFNIKFRKVLLLPRGDDGRYGASLIGWSTNTFIGTFEKLTR